MFAFRQTARRWFDSALDVIYPPHCVHCKRGGAVWCMDCQQDIVPVAIVEAEAGGLVLDARGACAEFQGSVRSAIHALKYSGKQRLADPLGALLTATLSTTGWQPTLLTAVPLHPERLATRGYNQSALLAEQVARRCAVPLNNAVLTRTRATRPQVGLNYHDRQQNMAAAFLSGDVQGQSVVVIDDVYTTGATLRGCAAALRQAGAVKIWALTVTSARSVDADRAPRPAH